MRKLLNIALAVVAVLGLVQASTEVSGFGAGVPVAALRTQGVLDLEKAFEANPCWCGPDCSVEIGRYVANNYISSLAIVSGLALAVAVANLVETDGNSTP